MEKNFDISFRVLDRKWGAKASLMIAAVFVCPQALLEYGNMRLKSLVAWSLVWKEICLATNCVHRASASITP